MGDSSPTRPAERGARTNERGATLWVRIKRRPITATLETILFLSFAASALRGHWLVAASTVGIILVTWAPALLSRRYQVSIPPVFELLAIIFIFSSMFLGEVHGYYTRFWWWDAVLHIGSGFLLGILGFVIVYALNQRTLGDLGLKPSFIAIFAFSFSVALGGLWEIFEFAMDQLFGLNMQKSGLVDTMWDLIVDTVGAAVIAILGYGYLKTEEIDSFLERWIHRITIGRKRDLSPGLSHEGDHD
jgi:hypothetical protein